MAYRAGIKAQIYVEGTLAKGAQDITVPWTKNEIAVRTRGSRFVKYLPGLIDGPIDFEILYDPDDPVYQALHDAFWSDADDNYLEIEITDRKKTAASWRGIKADFIVTNFEQTDPLEDTSSRSVSIRFAAESDNEPVETGSDVP